MGIELRYQEDKNDLLGREAIKRIRKSQILVKFNVLWKASLGKKKEKEVDEERSSENQAEL